MSKKLHSTQFEYLDQPQKTFFCWPFLFPLLPRAHESHRNVGHLVFFFFFFFFLLPRKSERKFATGFTQIIASVSENVNFEYNSREREKEIHGDGQTSQWYSAYFWSWWRSWWRSGASIAKLLKKVRQEGSFWAPASTPLSDANGKYRNHFNRGFFFSPSPSPISSFSLYLSISFSLSLSLSPFIHFFLRLFLFPPPSRPVLPCNRIAPE